MSIKFDYNEVAQYIKDYGNDQTRYYLGADSCRFRKNGLWWADYTLALAIHRHTPGGQGTGCKVFGKSIIERSYDERSDRPAKRLMRECVLLSEFFMELLPLLEDKHHVELHIDINKDKTAGSNFIMEQAIGYLRGIAGNYATIQVKPESPVASFAADRLQEIIS